LWISADNSLCFAAELISAELPSRGNGNSLSTFAYLAVYPLLHALYVSKPNLLLGVFPSLSLAALRHIPLAVSVTTTSAVTAGLALASAYVKHIEAQEVYSRDLHIVKMHPACRTGLQKVLLQRERAMLASAGKESMDWDMGTTDPL
jgi:hypothetical protein